MYMYTGTINIQIYCTALPEYRRSTRVPYRYIYEYTYMYYGINTALSA